MRITICRKEHFNAAHRLHNPKWSDEKNRAVFGLCNSPNYHGHNYNLTIKITGEIDEEYGYVMDLKQLSDLIKQEITLKFDHKNLNLDVAYFSKVNPTAENIAIRIWDVLDAALKENFTKPLELKVILEETERNFVEYPPA